jgi:hypothetical protein
MRLCTLLLLLLLKLIVSNLWLHRIGFFGAFGRLMPRHRLGHIFRRRSAEMRPHTGLLLLLVLVQGGEGAVVHRVHERRLPSFRRVGSGLVGPAIVPLPCGDSFVARS